MLRSRGGTPGPPTTGRRRSAIAREFAPDAVVLDIVLPDIDGFEVLRRLRAGNRACACCS